MAHRRQKQRETTVKGQKRTKKDNKGKKRTEMEKRTEKDLWKISMLWHNTRLIDGVGKNYVRVSLQLGLHVSPPT